MFFVRLYFLISHVTVSMDNFKRSNFVARLKLLTKNQAKMYIRFYGSINCRTSVTFYRSIIALPTKLHESNFIPYISMYGFVP